MIYLTSDLHWFHNQKFIYEPRGFKSCEEMTNYMIDQWKSVVKPEDDVYIGGDFCLGTDYDKIEQTIKSLPGTIHLIIGNHDTDKKVEFYKSLGIDVKYADIIIYKKRRFYLSHYITHTATLESDPKTCMINLHGHIHTKNKFFEDMPFLYNISVDANNNKLITLDNVISNFNKKVKDCYKSLMD